MLIGAVGKGVNPCYQLVTRCDAFKLGKESNLADDRSLHKGLSPTAALSINTAHPVITISCYLVST